MKEEKTIYNMELHEEFKIDKWISVLKVHEGWIYNIYDPDCSTVQSIYVPFTLNHMKAVIVDKETAQQVAIKKASKGLEPGSIISLDKEGFPIDP